MKAGTVGTAPPESAIGRRREGESLVGTWTLIRFILRRDRVRMPVWALGIIVSLVGVAQSYAATFPTRSDLDSRATLVDNPIFIAFNGPGHGLDNYTLGAMVANEALYLGVVLVALMSVFLVVRHTRAEEESGRAELIRSAVVGRHAGTASSIVVVGGLNVVVGLLTSAGLASMDKLDGPGSLTFGMSMIAAGLVFTAVAAVAAQLTEYGRGAIGIGVAVLGATYLLRAIGDVSETGLSWVSPFAWSLETRAFVDERWWPLLLSLSLAVVLTIGAMVLSTRRDVGAGLVAARPGRPRASDQLVRPTGLALRLQRGGLIAWAAGLAVLGVSFGPLVGDIEEFAAENEQIRDIIATAAGTSLVESFLGTITGMLALIATGFAIQSAVRMRAEEVSGRVEPVLATALPRHRWVAAYLAVTMGGSAIVMLAGSLMMGVTAAANQQNSSLLWELLAGGLAHLPAIWVAAGVAVALFGVLPSLVRAAWLVLVYDVIVGLLGPALGLADSPARNISPFGHVPQLPGADFSLTPIAILIAVAGALIGIGMAGFRRRDLYST